jgi:RNA polymerase sigma-70 factor (ECF subfamily)
LSLDEPLPPSTALNSHEVEPEDAVILNERGALIQDMLTELPPDYRAAVVLRYWYDLSYLEIAQALDTTESAVKSRLFRARQALADKMTGARGNAALHFAWEGAR